LAAELTTRLLRPGVLDEGLRSGLFLSGLRRTGKTTFLRTDLVPELEAQGALVIYVDLWSDTKVSPAALVQAAVRQTLTQLATPSSPLLARLKRIRGLDLGGMGFRFGFQLEQLGEAGGATLAQAFTEVVDQSGGDVVLIVDEVQQAITTEEGNQMLLALKAARDAINPRPGTPGHFLFLGTGSHRALVSELTARRHLIALSRAGSGVRAACAGAASRREDGAVAIGRIRLDQLSDPGTSPRGVPKGAWPATPQYDVRVSAGSAAAGDCRHAAGFGRRSGAAQGGADRRLGDGDL